MPVRLKSQPFLTKSDTSRSQFTLPVYYSVALNVFVSIAFCVCFCTENIWETLRLLCSACRLISRWFLACLLLRPFRCRRDLLPKCRLNFNGLHGVVSQSEKQNQKGRGRKRSWHNLRYYPSICLEGQRKSAKKTTKNNGYTISLPRLEPRTSK
jgi:hypothetical protein